MKEFVTTMTSMLRILMNKVDSMQEQTGNLSREMKILKKNQKGELEFKNVVSGIIVLDGLIVGMAVERISELEDILIETSTTERQREKKQNRKNIQGLWDNERRHNKHVEGIPGGEREKGTKEIFKTIMTGNFLRIYVRHQTTNPGSSENSEYDKYQETTCRHIISLSNYRKSKEKIQKKP